MKVQICQGLGSTFQIELLKTGRTHSSSELVYFLLLFRTCQDVLPTRPADMRGAGGNWRLLGARTEYTIVKLGIIGGSKFRVSIGRDFLGPELKQGEGWWDESPAASAQTRVLRLPVPFDLSSDRPSQCHAFPGPPGREKGREREREREIRERAERGERKKEREKMRESVTTSPLADTGLASVFRGAPRHAARTPSPAAR